MTFSCTEERFLKDVAKHKMTILMDEGLYRHIRFRGEGSPYWFDIVTYPGRLIIDGDCGAYVFARLEDMFEFFRTDADSDWLKRNNFKLGINPSYWGEKLLAVNNSGCGKGNIQEFSEELFKIKVKEYFDSYFEEEIETEKELIAEVNGVEPDLAKKDFETIAKNRTKREEIWGDIECDVLGYKDNEYDANKAAYDFSEQGFRFVDFHEYNCNEYNFHYIWNCYAVAMGVKMYDDYKMKVIANA